MIYFTIILFIYCYGLIFARVQPASLKMQQSSLLEHIKSIKITLLLGVLLIFIFWISTDYTFVNVNDNFYMKYSLHNNIEYFTHMPYSILSNIFIHINLVHFLGNLAFLAVFSIYEKQVGSLRYLYVLGVSVFVSNLSVFFYNEPVAISGISGGLYGLMAGFVLDRNLDTKDFIKMLLSFIAVGVIYIVTSYIFPVYPLSLNIDYYGHFLGFIASVLYIKFVPRKLNKVRIVSITRP